jgi:hypothetical protein
MNGLGGPEFAWSWVGRGGHIGGEPVYERRQGRLIAFERIAFVVVEVELLELRSKTAPTGVG